MAFNERGGSTDVLSWGSFVAVLMHCKDQRVDALQKFAARDLKLTPSVLIKHNVTPKPSVIIKRGEQLINVKLDGSVFGAKLSIIVTVHASAYSKTPAANQDVANPCWLVRWADNTKQINMKPANEPIEVGGLTVMCPTLVDVKDIAAGEQLYAMAVKTFA